VRPREGIGGGEGGLGEELSEEDVHEWGEGRGDEGEGANTIDVRKLLPSVRVWSLEDIK